ncbi:unnamed protein product [Paramecium sonneborni]|uniref:Uncharacterized protein n=1 Tax=Paramecium sonneborni TaxID=65129 RepID=A0A8S1LM38_9CILI|nr:unnamed protein product [Paramecium sonneborni]
MDLSAFLFDNLPQPQENYEQIQDDCHQYLSKLNYNKSLFRIQSPELSIQDDCLSNVNDQSFEIGLGELKLSHELKNEITENDIKSFPKKAQKTQKLNKKRKRQNGPLSEQEFIDIMKKLDQCQQVMNMIDNMSLVLNRFKCQLQQQRFERIQ